MTAVSIPRGKIKAFRALLNRQNTEMVARQATRPVGDPCRVAATYRNGRYHQSKRLYGDYLYHQDREKFMVDLRDWVAAGEPQ